MRCRVGFYTPPRHVLEYLVVAGGGGGFASGGGAGGVLAGTLALPREAAVTVTVGTGGAGDFDDNGTNSVLGTLTAIGGGGGTSGRFNGKAGGSGGGGGPTTSGTTSGGAGTAGQGVAGEDGAVNNPGRGGGLYLYSTITGTPSFYAAGGGVTTLGPNSGSGGRASFTTGSGGIVVSGAGTAAANGTYDIDGTFNDSPQYRLADTNYYIRNNLLNWNIVDGDTILYELNATPADPGSYNPYTGPLPSGPATAVNGAAPAPTIAADTTTVPAENGADGVVVIAYPDDMPALTVGSGLTYDQPTRAGYRVYRFTSGTGTITLP